MSPLPQTLSTLFTFGLLDSRWWQLQPSTAQAKTWGPLTRSFHAHIISKFSQPLWTSIPTSSIRSPSSTPLPWINSVASHLTPGMDPEIQISGQPVCWHLTQKSTQTSSMCPLNFYSVNTSCNQHPDWETGHCQHTRTLPPTPSHESSLLTWLLWHRFILSALQG